MGAFAARFFGYVQDADFYRDLHREAVALLPVGAGRTWFDVGCGPGLVARLAHERGYDAVGFDIDADMVRLACRRSAAAAVGLRYVESGLDDLVVKNGRADVVSAASLLNVLPDRRAALIQLLDAVAPGGTLLVVETSDMMASLRAGDRRRKLALGHRAWVLRLWARARLGTRAVDIEALCPNEYAVQRHALLGGLVNAWLVRCEIGHDSAVPTRGQWPAADE
jgi:ubiquinone/menaquinone biosynthesis C-methylase UbiE